MIQWMLAIWSLVPLPFSKSSLNIWKFTVHVLLIPGLVNFEHYFSSLWDECNCAVVWVFFGIAFLWDWNENRTFPVLWPLLSFLNFLAFEYSTFRASSFRIWNSSTRIPSPPLALFLGLLPRARLTSHVAKCSQGWGGAESFLVENHWYWRTFVKDTDFARTHIYWIMYPSFKKLSLVIKTEKWTHGYIFKAELCIQNLLDLEIQGLSLRAGDAWIISWRCYPIK